MTVRVSTLLGNGPFVRSEDATEMPTDGTSRPGAIVIEVDGEEFIGTDLFDEINDFWPLFLNGVEDLRANGTGESSWADQWIWVEYAGFETEDQVSVEMLLVVDDVPVQEAEVDLVEFCRAVGDAALVFFDKAETLDPEHFNGYDAYREMIERWRAEDASSR